MGSGLVHILKREILRQRKDIQVIGMDLDGTLTDLHTREVIKLIGDRTVNLLPDDLKKALGTTNYAGLEKKVKVSPNWYIDLKNGYLVLPNSRGEVMKARVGINYLPVAVIAAEYSGGIDLDIPLHMDKQKPRFLPMCDGYDFIEGTITAGLISMPGLPRKRTLEQIAQAVRKAHDDAERGFKNEMLRDPEKYRIMGDPKHHEDLIKFLRDLKLAGYKIFIMSASKERYVRRMLNILGLNEKDYSERIFEKILTGTRKPECFKVGTPHNTRLLKALRRMGIETPADYGKVLYIGDHLYKDIVFARQHGFRTCLRLPRTHIVNDERKLGKYSGVEFKVDNGYKTASGQPSSKQLRQTSNYLAQLYQNAQILVSKIMYLRPLLLHQSSHS